MEHAELQPLFVADNVNNNDLTHPSLHPSISIVYVHVNCKLTPLPSGAYQSGPGVFYAYIQDIVILTFSECFQSQFWVYNQLVHGSSTGHQEYDGSYHLTQIQSSNCDDNNTTHILSFQKERICVLFRIKLNELN